MKNGTRNILAAAFGIATLFAATTASAHDNDRGEHRGHGWGHEKHWRGDYYDRDMVRERVFIRQPPPVVYERQVYYDAPYYAYPRNPGIVIGIPPIVIPLR